MYLVLAGFTFKIIDYCVHKCDPFRLVCQQKLVDPLMHYPHHPKKVMQTDRIKRARDSA